MPKVGYRHSAETKRRLALAWEVRRQRDHNFWNRVTDTGFCWLFDGINSAHGYGEVTVRGKRWRAHRFAYEQLIGPIPEGLTLDHLCGILACVNPDHLEPVSMRENVLRSHTAATAVNARKTHCKRGHPFSPENTASRSGGRACRICERDYQRGRRELRRSERSYLSLVGPGD